MLKRDNEQPSDGARSFQARYGATIMRGGIAAIPTALYTYQAELGLAPQHVWFIGYILAHKWDEDLPYPSLVRMAECTGISYRQLHRIKNDLVERGMLDLVARTNVEGGKDSNAYDFSTLFGYLEEFLRRDRQERDEQGRQFTPLRGRVVATKSHEHRTSVTHAPVPVVSDGDRTLASDGDRTSTSNGYGTSVSDGDETSTSDRDRTPVSAEYRTPVSHKEEPAVKEAFNKNIESKNDHAQEPTNGDSNPYSPWISGVIVDYSRELGEAANASANVSRALRLWGHSGMDEEEFVAVLQQARSLLRRAQGGQGQKGIARKMAYFFTVVADLASDQE